MRRLIVACITSLVAACGPGASVKPVLEGTLDIISLNRLQGLAGTIPCQPGDLAVLPAAAELRDRIEADGGTALLVAIGDSINRSYKVLHGKAAELASMARSRVNLEALAAAGVNVYVPGHADLATGFDEVLSLCESAGIPVLLSNVIAPKHPHVKQSMVVQVGNLKVGLLGVVASRVADVEAELEEGASKPGAMDMVYPGASILPAQEAVEPLVAELRSQQGVDLVILFSNVSQKSNSRLASVAGINVIIGSTDTAFEADRIIIDKSAAIMSSASAGRQVGHTTLAVRGGNLQFADLSPARQIPGQIETVERRLAEYAARYGTDDPTTLARLVAPGDEQSFLNMISLLAENKEFLKLREHWMDSYIDHRAADLQPARLDHPAQAAPGSYGARIEAALAASNLQPLVIPEGRPLIPSPEDCASCHAAQYDFWKGTAHSRAFEDLKPLNLTHDGSCLECHAAGFEDPSGWTDPRFDAPFGGVTCFQCHKSYSLHSESVRQVLDPQYVQSDPEKMMCSDCHVDRRSPGFDKQAALASVSCPPMRADEPALLLARKAALDAIANRRSKGLAVPRDDYLEGRALLGLGAFEQGCAVLEAHALANPADAVLRVTIAQQFEQVGNSSGAIELLRKFIADYSGEPLTNLLYVTLLLEARDVGARDPQTALTRLQFLLPKDADDSRKVALDFRVLMIDAYFATGQIEEGLALINQLSREHAEDPRLKSRIARYVNR